MNRPWLALHPHPSQTPAAGARVCVGLAREADGGLRLAYRLDGGAGGLRRPAGTPGQRRDGLWQQTCCELFVAHAPATPSLPRPYREFNFSPAGEWAAYDFAAYRQPSDPCPTLAPPSLANRYEGAVLQLDVCLPAASVPDSLLSLQASVVLCAADGQCSHWAFAHPAPRPDFHHPAGFVAAAGLLSPSRS